MPEARSRSSPSAARKSGETVCSKWPVKKLQKLQDLRYVACSTYATLTVHFLHFQILLLRFCSLLFLIACTIGCLIQIQAISRIYFKYETVSELTLAIPSTVQAPDLSVCFRYTDIFNITEFNAKSKKTNPKSGGKLNVTEKSNREDGAAIRIIQASVTIADVFDFTPSTDEIIKT